MLKSYFYSPASTWMSGLCEPEYQQIKTNHEVIQSTCAYRTMAWNAAFTYFFPTEEIYPGKSTGTSNIVICHRQTNSISIKK